MSVYFTLIPAYRSQKWKTIASRYTLGDYVVEDRYHTEVVRSQLTRNIAGLFDDIKDEITQAYSDNIVLEGSGMSFVLLEKRLLLTSQINFRVESISCFGDGDADCL